MLIIAAQYFNRNLILYVHMVIYLFTECHSKYIGLNFIISMDGKLLESTVKVI